MIIIPIRTEMIARRTPLANYAIIAANCVAFAVFEMSGSDALESFRQRHLMLLSDWPSLYQFFTYQFLHAGIAHLAGNMLFLWVFGNAVNAKMGDVPYLLFYLAAGVFAGWVFALGNGERLVGASGAIAGVTTAYLALFPRSRVTVLYILFFIGFFEVPAMVLIGLKVILWDNIIAPSLQGSGNVATEAHLGGYVFGFVGAIVMLMVRAVHRDHFDVLALLNRWNRRRAFRKALAGEPPVAPGEAGLGRVARKIPSSVVEQQLEGAQMDQITDLRGQISGHLDRGDVATGATMYQQLVALDPSQCLPARHQLLVAREYYAGGRSPQAAGAFERYVVCYPHGPEANEVRLLLGIIYARDLRQYATAEKHLEASLEKLSGGDRRAQCAKWLDTVRQALGRPAADA